MYDEASNVQIGGELVIINYPMLTVMHSVKHTISIFFNDDSQITIVNQIITAHK